MSSCIPASILYPFISSDQSTYRLTQSGANIDSKKNFRSLNAFLKNKLPLSRKFFLTARVHLGYTARLTQRENPGACGSPRVSQSPARWWWKHKVTSARRIPSKDYRKRDSPTPELSWVLGYPIWAVLAHQIYKHQKQLAADPTGQIYVTSSKSYSDSQSEQRYPIKFLLSIYLIRPISI